MAGNQGSSGQSADPYDFLAFETLFIRDDDDGASVDSHLLANVVNSCEGEPYRFHRYRCRITFGYERHHFHDMAYAFYSHLEFLRSQYERYQDMYQDIAGNQGSSGQAANPYDNHDGASVDCHLPLANVVNSCDREPYQFHRNRQCQDMADDFRSRLETLCGQYKQYRDMAGNQGSSGQAADPYDNHDGTSVDWHLFPKPYHEILAVICLISIATDLAITYRWYAHPQISYVVSFLDIIRADILLPMLLLILPLEQLSVYLGITCDIDDEHVVPKPNHEILAATYLFLIAIDLAIAYRWDAYPRISCFVSLLHILPAFQYLFFRLIDLLTELNAYEWRKYISCMCSIPMFCFLVYPPFRPQLKIAFGVLVTLSSFDCYRRLLSRFCSASFLALAYRCLRMRLLGVRKPRVALRPSEYPQLGYQEVEYFYCFGKNKGLNCESTFHLQKPFRARRASSLQTTFFAMAAINVFGPLVGALPNVSARDWSSTAVISSSSACSTQIISGERISTWSLVQAKGLDLLMNTLALLVILLLSYWIYSRFCDSSLQTIDKTRKLGLVCMVLYQAAYYHIRDDPNSSRGVILAVFIASAGFTYKFSSRGAARFNFGLVYAVAGISVGLLILSAVTAGLTSKFGGPSWDVLFSPCLAFAFAFFEMGAHCFRANMRFRDDELQNGNRRMPYYHNIQITRRSEREYSWPDDNLQSDGNVPLLHSGELLQPVDQTFEPNELPEQPANPWA